MGPDFPQTVASLGSMGQQVLAAADKGLDTGVKLAASNVVSQYLTGQSLKRRTGSLARHVQGWLAESLHGVVGISDPSTVDRYKWLLGDEQMTILPKKGKFLTVPIGEALTGAGVLKGEYSGGLRSIAGGFFVRSKGSLLFGYKRGKKGKFRALFVLVKSVFVQGSGALYDGVNDSLDDITGSMQSEIDKVVSS